MIDRLQPLLKPGQCAAVFSPENRRYYTGMNTSNGLLLATAEQAVFFTDFRYITAAKEKIEPEIPVRLFEGSAARTLSGFLAETGCREVLYEEDFLPAGRWIRMLISKMPEGGKLCKKKHRAFPLRMAPR